MSIDVSGKTAIWIRTVVTVVSVILFLIGLAGIPDDLMTWATWIALLQAGVPWWVFLLTSAVLIALTWIPRVQVLSSPRDTPAEGNTTTSFSPESTEQGLVSESQAALDDCRLEVDRLRNRISQLTALPDRVIGLLAAGRSLSLRELKQQLAIADDDREGAAALQACLGVLVSRRVVEHYSGSIESYTLTKDWQDRADRQLSGNS